MCFRIRDPTTPSPTHCLNQWHEPGRSYLFCPTNETRWIVQRKPVRMSFRKPLGVTSAAELTHFTLKNRMKNDVWCLQQNIETRIPLSLYILHGWQSLKQSLANILLIITIKKKPFPVKSCQPFVDTSFWCGLSRRWLFFYTFYTGNYPH